MLTSRSVAQVVAQTAAELDDTFEITDASVGNVYFLHARRPAKAVPRTLTECVPLLTVAAEFIKRGPGDVTIEAVEAYRIRAMELLAEIKPVIESRAEVSLDDWAVEMLARPEVTRSLA
jgi:hypothetical protein